MKKLNKSLQKIFKEFFYGLFHLIYGKIKGVISYKDDSRIETFVANFENEIKYKVFTIKEGRLYTDRIQDTAIILENKIVEGPSFQLRPVNNVSSDQNIVFKKGTPRLKKNLSGTTLSLLTGGAGNDNYFHWLFDVLPRFKICEKVFDISKVDYFLLPDFRKKFQVESLDMLKIPRNKRLSSKNFRHIKTDQIIITQHPYCINNDADNEIENIPPWISEWLKSVYLNKKLVISKNYPAKIYIDRKDSTSNTSKLRSILNEKEVINLLKNDNFEIISLSDYPFEEQVRIINSAKMIVGLHGAGFANFCFCEPDTKIVELKSNTAGKMYENLAIDNKLDYKSVSCEQIGTNFNNQFGHIKVPIEELKKKIK